MGESKLANIIYVVTHIDPYTDELHGSIEGVFDNKARAIEFAQTISRDVEVEAYEINATEAEGEIVYSRWWG